MASTGRATYRLHRTLRVGGVLFGTLWLTFLITAPPAEEDVNAAGASIAEDSAPLTGVAVHVPRPAVLAEGRSLPEQADIEQVGEDFLEAWYTYNATKKADKHIEGVPGMAPALKAELTTKNRTRFQSEREFKIVSTVKKVDYTVPTVSHSATHMEYVVTLAVKSTSTNNKPEKATARGQIVVERDQDNGWQVTSLNTSN